MNHRRGKKQRKIGFKMVMLFVVCICLGMLETIAPIHMLGINRVEAASNVHKYNDYEYSIINKRVIIRKYCGKATKLTIPSKIKGYPVRVIGAFAFQRNSSIQTIVMPSSVTKIKSYAFSECSRLKNVSISKNVRVIEQ